MIGDIERKEEKRKEENHHHHHQNAHHLSRAIRSPQVNGAEPSLLILLVL